MLLIDVIKHWLTLFLGDRSALAPAPAAAAPNGGPLRRDEAAVALLAADQGNTARPRPHAAAANQLIRSAATAQQEGYASRPHPL